MQFSPCYVHDRRRSSSCLLLHNNRLETTEFDVWCKRLKAAVPHVYTMYTLLRSAGGAMGGEGWWDGQYLPSQTHSLSPVHTLPFVIELHLTWTTCTHNITFSRVLKYTAVDGGGCVCACGGLQSQTPAHQFTEYLSLTHTLPDAYSGEILTAKTKVSSIEKPPRVTTHCTCVAEQVTRLKPIVAHPEML